MIGVVIVIKELQAVSKFEKWLSETNSRIINRTEFTLKALDVRGRQRSSLDGIKQAILGEETQVSSLQFDPIIVRQKIEGIDWIRSAQVSIVHPDTILVSLEEYIPAGIWYDGGELWVLDPGGIKIATTKNRNYWPQLPFIIGRDAPTALNEFLNNIARAPLLKARLKAAVWTGGRHWTFMLNSGAKISMPERHFGMALQTLQKQHGQNGILDRAIEGLDLRNPFEPVIRLTPEVLSITQDVGK